MLKEKALKNKNRRLRARRTRKTIKAKNNLPRLSVFRSLKHLSAQIIDDQQEKTLVAVHDKEIKGADKKQPRQIAEELGKLIAQKAKEAKIEEVVFDRGHYKYHGTIKALADSAREGGLKF